MSRTFMKIGALLAPPSFCRFRLPIQQRKARKIVFIASGRYDESCSRRQQRRSERHLLNHLLNKGVLK